MDIRESQSKNNVSGIINEGTDSEKTLAGRGTPKRSPTHPNESRFSKNQQNKN